MDRMGEIELEKSIIKVFTYSFIVCFLTLLLIRERVENVQDTNGFYSPPVVTPYADYFLNIFRDSIKASIVVLIIFLIYKLVTKKLRNNVV